MLGRRNSNSRKANVSIKLSSEIMRLCQERQSSRMDAVEGNHLRSSEWIVGNTGAAQKR
jgi:hypothetical protein